MTQIDADFLSDVNIGVLIGYSLKYTASEFNAKMTVVASASGEYPAAHGGR